MRKKDKLIYILIIIEFCTYGILAAPSEHFKVFLCFGQSNMTGGAGVNPEQIDKAIHNRVKVLGFATSTCGSVSRIANEWSDACEPMHCGDGVNAVGPSFAFGKALADSLPDDTIGIIPCGQWGVNISFFQKGGFYNGTRPSVPGGTNVYEWMLNKCKIAQKRGVLTGIIMQQGESNTGDGKAWISKVKSIVNDLKTDLQLEEDIPFIAGELREDKNAAFNNNVIRYLPDSIPRCHVVSSHGLGTFADQYNLHFNQAGERELGKRFAIEMLKEIRKPTSIASKNSRFIRPESVKFKNSDAAIYSLDGKIIQSNRRGLGPSGNSRILPCNIYLIKDDARYGSAKLMLAPLK